MLISDRVHPHVSFGMEQVKIGNAGVLAVYVHAGRDGPYGVGTNLQNLAYYVPCGGNSIIARPEDLRNPVLSRAPAPLDQSGGLL